MKVVFNGTLETKASGCVPCQRKRVTKQSMTTKKEYYLPSGIKKVFYLGRAEEVTDADGEFLLSINSVSDGLNTFTRVD